MNYAWLRTVCAVNRFGTLPRVTRALASAPKDATVTRRLFGHRIELAISRSSAQQLLLVEGERFVEERQLLRSLLRPGMTVVDVGANIGYYMLLAEQAIGATGKVICIEPSSENLPELRRAIAINSLKNVTLHEVALGDHEGDVGLHAGINSGVSDVGSASYTVPLRRLDQLVQEPVHFLKIDVEGYEGQVLAGASALLSKFKPILFLELHPHIVGKFGYSVRAILDNLSPYYRNTTLYEKTPSERMGLVGKVASRYFGRDVMRPINAPEEYVERYDRGNAQHTYWAVCTP